MSKTISKNRQAGAMDQPTMVTVQENFGPAMHLTTLKRQQTAGPHDPGHDDLHGQSNDSISVMSAASFSCSDDDMCRQDTGCCGRRCRRWD